MVGHGCHGLLIQICPGHGSNFLVAAIKEGHPRHFQFALLDSNPARAVEDRNDPNISQSRFTYCVLAST
jgi:hypothetical protein